MGLAGIGVAVFLIVGGVIVSAMGMMRAVRERAARPGGGGTSSAKKAEKAAKAPKADGAKGRSDKPWVVSCISCEKKLRVPRGRGSLQVTCPQCKTRFAFDSDSGKNIG